MLTRLSTLFAALIFCLAAAGSGADASQDLGAIRIPQHQILELVFHAAHPLTYNPSVSYPFRISLTDPEGTSSIVDAFYDGPAPRHPEQHLWKARLAPSKPGLWRWVTLAGDVPNDALTGLTGTFTCTPQDGPGGLVPRRHHFFLQNGDLTYLQGNFLDFDEGLVSTHVLLSHRLPFHKRRRILDRQQHHHGANKINIYLANRGDYANMSVIPWDEEELRQGRLVVDLDFWNAADSLLAEVREKGMFAELWFFADDSGFGAMPLEVKKAFYRYAMARLSAFNHTLFVIALEWNEEWSKADVVASGRFIQHHNPWKRPLSVHGLEIYPPQDGLQALFTRTVRHYITTWPFSGMEWPTFIASQAGNKAQLEQVNRLAVRLRKETLPHLSEEFGHLRAPDDPRMRAKTWGNLCGGAAGGGTGSGIRALLDFLAQYRPPLARMAPSNHLVPGGGRTRFVLAEPGHHYLVYSLGGNVTLAHTGSGLKAVWYNPRSGGLAGSPFPVSPGERTDFSPPSPDDWVLWVSDGHELADVTLRPGPALTHVVPIGP